MKGAAEVTEILLSMLTELRKSIDTLLSEKVDTTLRDLSYFEEEFKNMREEAKKHASCAGRTFKIGEGYKLFVKISSLLTNAADIVKAELSSTIEEARMDTLRGGFDYQIINSREAGLLAGCISGLTDRNFWCSKCADVVKEILSDMDRTIKGMREQLYLQEMATSDSQESDASLGPIKDVLRDGVKTLLEIEKKLRDLGRQNQDFLDQRPEEEVIPRNIFNFKDDIGVVIEAIKFEIETLNDLLAREKRNSHAMVVGALGGAAGAASAAETVPDLAAEEGDAAAESAPYLGG